MNNKRVVYHLATARLTRRGEMMEAWDVIVIGDGPAAMRAAIESAGSGASTLLSSPFSLGAGNACAMDGLAASIMEADSKSHSNDTIQAGAFLCDQDIVAKRVANAVSQVNLLERWGVIFRRNTKGTPHAVTAFGHSKPRVTGAGDAMVKETQQVLEEQCIRQGVVRRGNQIPLELVHRNQSICGVIMLDMTTGQLYPLQAKTVIIADGGFEEAWNGSNYSGGLGMDLALRAGISLRDMEFIARSPLALSGTNIILPLGILNDGASLHSADGADLEITPDADMHYVIEKIQQTPNPVLDARELKSQWWNGINKQISQRLGVEIDKQTLAISCKAVSTIGGIPVDENGRVVTEKWSRWFTGLYAAGDAACSGMHGAGMIVGNRLLDALAGGAAAGKHAGEWSQGASFSGRGELEAVIGAAEAELDLLFIEEEGAVLRSGSITADLTQVMDSSMGFEREEKGLSTGLEKLLQLSDTAGQIHCDDQSRLYNDNLRQILYLKAMIRLSIAATRSALARKESRGLHQRSDYPQIDNDQLHHTLVDKDGNISSLAIRKGSSGTWLIAPSA